MVAIFFSGKALKCLKTVCMRLLSALFLSLVLCQASSEHWLIDFEQAKQEAKEQGKFILADFTGTDWCHFCILLNKEVFSKEEFVKEASKKFIFLEVDFPKDKSKLSAETQAQNAQLKQLYKPQGYPTVILMNAEGRPFNMTGYNEGGVPPFLEDLNSRLAIYESFQAEIKASENLEGKEKADAIESALIEYIPSQYFTHYPELVATLTELKPQNRIALEAEMLEEEEKLISTLRKLYKEEPTLEQVTANRQLLVPQIEGFIKKYNPQGRKMIDMLRHLVRQKVTLFLFQEKYQEAITAADSVIEELELSPYSQQFVLHMKTNLMEEINRNNGAQVPTFTREKVIAIHEEIIALDPESDIAEYTKGVLARLTTTQPQETK